MTSPRYSEEPAPAPKGMFWRVKHYSRSCWVVELRRARLLGSVQVSRLYVGVAPGPITPKGFIQSAKRDLLADLERQRRDRKRVDERKILDLAGDSAD